MIPGIHHGSILYSKDSMSLSGGRALEREIKGYWPNCGLEEEKLGNLRRWTEYVLGRGVSWENRQFAWGRERKI